MADRLDIFRNNQTVSNLSVLDQAILLFEIQNKYVSELGSHDCNVIAGLLKELVKLQELIPKWHLVKIRPLTDEEREEYRDEFEFVYECELPDHGQEVLVATKFGVDKTTFYTDCGSYFENYEDEGEVIAWMELPKFEEVE